MDRTFTGLAVGRLVPVKRFDVLIEAWKSIPVPLKIVGEGPERPKLENQIRSLGIEGRVVLLGERSDVPELMEQAQLLAVTSEHEGFGYVILEALQKQLFVVSTNTGVARDLLPNEYLLSDCDPSAVSITVRGLLDDVESASSKFGEVWKLAKKYTVRQMVQDTVGVYQTTLDESDA